LAEHWDKINQTNSQYQKVINFNDERNYSSNQQSQKIK
jgi:hypothetical protein